jgi:hypothetical protein
LKRVLKAVANLTQVDIKDAAVFTRKHPLWQEEIHIEEELINLEEAFATGAAAGESLRHYPQMRIPLIKEQRAVLRHCIGLIERMTTGKELPREYGEDDIKFAIVKLIRLIVNEALRVGKSIDEEVLQAIRPYLSLRQRWHLGQWAQYSPRMELEMLKRRFVAARQVG